MAPPADDFSTVDALRTHEAAARQWMLRGVGSLLSLWNDEVGGAFRHTEDFNNPQEFRPTATFHSIVALAECNVWHTQTIYDARQCKLRIPFGDVPCNTAPPTAAAVLRCIVEDGHSRPGIRADEGRWLLAVIERSSHSHTEEKLPSSRFTIPLERLVTAMSLLMKAIPDNELEPMAPTIRAGLFAAERELRHLVTRSGVPLNAAEIYESRDFAPAILFNVVTCLDAMRTCYQRLGCENEREISPDEIDSMLKNLRDATIRNVDYHMARHSVALDPSYDPVSLTFALRALCVTSPEERRFAFFRACIDAIVARQHQDGCWPDGVSITFEPTADVVQQPSVGVALHLAECAINNDVVSEHSEEERSLLDSVLPALRKTMQYLRATYSELYVNGRTVSGWSSDRVRRRNYVETWITALSTRLLRRLWIGEKAALRSLALTRLGLPEHHAYYRLLDGAAEAWIEKVSEPDSITRPAAIVFERIVEPILRDRTAGDVFQSPSREAVSFIIFGPPGSGKTFFVQSLATFLGWPLVTITPGHFIHRGLEFIEAVAREIFDYLRLLNHAVVFFDECDELFRSRDDEAQRGTRSILSFATASMLPKLQDLHDSANVIFVLGTNYVRNIDAAVRRPGRFDEVLLFDRPDDEARERHIRAVLGSTARDNHIDELTTLTRGLTVKEVVRIANAAATGKTFPSETSLDDYREWLRRDAPGELQASRYDARVRDAIRERWSTIAAD